MKILRIFILRFLISIPLFSLNLNLIKSLISMNNNLSFDDSYKWLKNNEIKLTIENVVELYYLLKENNFLQKKNLILMIIFFLIKQIKLKFLLFSK